MSAGTRQYYLLIRIVAGARKRATEGNYWYVGREYYPISINSHCRQLEYTHAYMSCVKMIVVRSRCLTRGKQKFSVTFQ